MDITYIISSVYLPHPPTHTHEQDVTQGKFLAEFNRINSEMSFS